jgi:hypothetical protein
MGSRGERPINPAKCVMTSVVGSSSERVLMMMGAVGVSTGAWGIRCVI